MALLMNLKKGATPSLKIMGLKPVLSSGGCELLSWRNAFPEDHGIETKIIESHWSSIVVGADVEVEGVRPPKAAEEDPDLIRAALVFVGTEDSDQLTGTIAEPVPADPLAEYFTITPSVGTESCFRISDETTILFVDTETSTVSPGEPAQLAVDQVVDLFGQSAANAMSDCFMADEVLVEGPPPADPGT